MKVNLIGIEVSFFIMFWIVELNCKDWCSSIKVHGSKKWSRHHLTQWSTNTSTLQPLQGRLDIKFTYNVNYDVVRETKKVIVMASITIEGTSPR
ncbi:hypothetical protein AQUCO_00800080v1 [Aquilegia coerulea]|uniref:Uncharacterized protein n=1 Tax=Aquilegia coerulea TaxID=218851 RepID=A0A2G5EH41_AQUCA|nr:hypothetical protein AQUCO_00800080v1 [Aquilegia coerulea]